MRTGLAVATGVGAGRTRWPVADLVADTAHVLEPEMALPCRRRESLARRTRVGARLWAIGC